MLYLTQEELRVVLAVLTRRYSQLANGDHRGKDDLRSAINKIAHECGYEEGAINAHMVRLKMEDGSIQK